MQRADHHAFVERTLLYNAFPDGEGENGVRRSSGPRRGQDGEGVPALRASGDSPVGSATST